MKILPEKFCTIIEWSRLILIRHRFSKIKVLKRYFYLFIIFLWILYNNVVLQFVSIYAAYLYDSVKLYASALHKLLSEQKLLTDGIIDEIASNGTKIVETIIGLKTYKS